MTEFKKENFDNYIKILLKWQKAINLISPKTISQVWERHFKDSLFLYNYVKDKENIFDIGSGGGFPGMVLSVAGIKNITFIEADERKCFFLNEIKKEYKLDCKIINERVENLKLKADTITSRAFAPLDKFLNLCENIISEKTEMYLLKGNNINKEIEDSKNNWNFDYNLYKKSDGFIIKISNISKKQ